MRYTQVNIKECSNIVFKEIPDLKFGTLDNEQVVFNASSFLAKQNPSASVALFFKDFKQQIEWQLGVYDISKDNVAFATKEGDILVDANLSILFLIFSSPTFVDFINDKASDIMINGFAVSDTYIIETAKQRIPQEVIYGRNETNI